MIRSVFQTVTSPPAIWGSQNYLSDSSPELSKQTGIISKAKDTVVISLGCSDPKDAMTGPEKLGKQHYLGRCKPTSPVTRPLWVLWRVKQVTK